MLSPSKQHTVVALGIGRGARLLLEFFGEGLVVEESPRVVEFVVPCPLKVYHGRYHIVHLFIADKGQQRRTGSIGVFGVWRIPLRRSYESSLRFAGSCRIRKAVSLSFLASVLFGCAHRLTIQVGVALKVDVAIAWAVVPR